MNVEQTEVLLVTKLHITIHVNNADRLKKICEELHLFLYGVILIA